MSVEQIKYSFVSGEISPTMLGRSDLDKYDLSVAEAVNFHVDYRGGLSNRPGDEFVDLVQYDWLDTKFFPFRFGPGVATSYTILMGNGYIRFIQNGSYVLEAAVAFTSISAANGAVVSAVGHPYAVGDLLKFRAIPQSVDMTKFGFDSLNDQVAVVSAVTANTYTLAHLDQAGTPLDTRLWDTVPARTGNAYRVYTVASPFATTDLAKMKFAQSRSVVDFTHASYAPRRLTRISDTNWTLAAISIGPALATPGVPTVTPSSAGTAGVAFCVTAVDADGNESLPSEYGFNALCVDYASTAGSVKVTWAAITGAQYYKVYRTQIIPVGADLTRAMQMGLAGIAYGPDFTDNNIVVDFTIGPPIYNDPFANSAIRLITVTAGGAGYTRASVVSVTGAPGTGFVGYPVVSAAGVLLAIVIVNGGHGYVAPIVGVTVGAGATFSVTVGEASGNYPRTSKVFQQRKVYAGEDNNPLRINGSQPKKYELFDESQILVDSDAYEFEVDADQVAPIHSLTTTRSGLLLWTAAGLFQLTGDTQTAVTPTDAFASPQSFAGAQDQIDPLHIDTEVLYVEAKGNTVRLLSYTDYTKVYSGQDMSILANHLIRADRMINAWDYASDPSKLVYMARDDGVILTLALVKEQNIFGWSRYYTSGLYYDVQVVQESQQDVVYVMTERFFDTIGAAPRWAKVISRFMPRDVDQAEDAKHLDCALILDNTYPAATIFIYECAFGATTNVTANSAIFAAGDVNKILRVGGGKFKVTVYNSTTSVTVQCLREMTKLVDQAPAPYWRAKSGDWTLDAVTTVLRGLMAYEGQTVRVLADGNLLADQVVRFGRALVPNGATKVVVGFPFTSWAKTLPVTINGQVVEGKLKRTAAAKIRVNDTRGLKAGPTLGDMSPTKERTNEPLGQETRLQKGVKEIIFDGSYDYDGSFYIAQESPLPMTILSFIGNVEVGDAPDQ